MLRTFWSAREAASEGVRQPFAGTEHECIEQLGLLLREAVALRMIADVPLGAFLSGGIDSSLVVALTQSLSSRPVRTYTVGFAEEVYNEAKQAKEVAERLGTAHTEFYLTAEETQRAIPDLPRYYDEPFADASQLPTMLVSRLARTEVTVALSGDGGDELFGGYTRHLWLNRIARVNRVIPLRLREALSRTLERTTSKGSSRPGVIDRLSRNALGIRNATASASKLAPLLLLDDPRDMYRRVVSTWNDPDKLMTGKSDLGSDDSYDEGEIFDNPATAAMWLDLTTYLPDDVLTKVDRASMAYGLEARVPLLDHRVVEFAWRIPLRWKIREGKGKWILRQLLAKYLPASVFERPKTGFGIPIGCARACEIGQATYSTNGSCGSKVFSMRGMSARCGTSIAAANATGNSTCGAS
jgi:asparagine synthase (glutamine-hydrolysing)